MTQAAYIAYLRGFIGALYRASRDPHTDRYWRRQYILFAKRLQNNAHLPADRFRPIVVGLISRAEAMVRHYTRLHRMTESRYWGARFLDYAVRFRQLSRDLRTLLAIVDERIRQLPHYPLYYYV